MTEVEGEQEKDTYDETQDSGVVAGELLAGLGSDAEGVGHAPHGHLQLFGRRGWRLVFAAEHRSEWQGKRIGLLYGIHREGFMISIASAGVATTVAGMWAPRMNPLARMDSKRAVRWS